jgi:hypothetical protein
LSLQTPPRLPPRTAAALGAALARLERHGVEALVAGSAGRALLGFAVRPRDLDLEVAAEDAGRAAAALGLLARDGDDGHAASTRARGRVAGVDVDLTAGLVVRGPLGRLPPDHAAMRRLARPVPVGPATAWVAPVEEQIVRAIVAGDEGRRLQIASEAPHGFRPDEDYVDARLSAARSAAR